VIIFPGELWGASYLASPLLLAQDLRTGFGLRSFRYLCSQKLHYQHGHQYITKVPAIPVEHGRAKCSLVYNGISITEGKCLRYTSLSPLWNFHSDCARDGLHVDRADVAICAVRLLEWDMEREKEQEREKCS
jgi:hypothetical protein